ncbi:hypothetical protein FRB93_000528 [Tulasnella sp. JGI-2019a]|nr:hypothetical protein FRB93_000528 [Tulasnella sp. JGI-2019a]
MRALDDPTSYLLAPGSFGTLAGIGSNGASPVWDSCLVVLITYYLPLQYRPGACRLSWLLTQHMLIPLVGQLVWVITYGVPPQLYEDYIPSQKKKGCAFTHEVAPVGKEEWYRGNATDPHGTIVPKPVDVYWVKPDPSVWGV